MNRPLLYFSLIMALVFSSCQNKAQNMSGQAYVSEFKLKSLFIYNPVQGKKLELTDFAFINASDNYII